MKASQNIIHLVDSSVGLEKTVFPVIRAGLAEAGQALLWHGEGPVPATLVEFAQQAELSWSAWTRRPKTDDTKAMVAWVQAVKATGIIVHGPSVLKIGLLAKRRTKGLRLVSADFYFQKPGVGNWFRSVSLHRNCDRVIYPSYGQRQEARQRLGSFYKAEKASVIVRGLDLRDWPVADSRHHASLPFIVGMQGPMEAGEDFATLLRAVAAYNAMRGHRLHLELVGDGPARADLQRLTLALGITADVSFLGALSSDKVAQRMSHWNIYAQSSGRNAAALIEAKASGLPIIAAATPTNSLHLRHGENGLLFPEGHAESLCEGLTLLVSQDDVRLRLASVSRREAEAEYSVARSWRAYRDALRPPTTRHLRLTQAIPVPG